MNPDEEQYIKVLESRLNKQEIDNNQKFSQQSGNTIFSGEYSENLIKWQLDIGEELERIEHLLRGQIPKRMDDGSERWIDPQDKSVIVFNEKGIQEVLKILSWYLSKNFILSNFGEEDIKLRVFQFGIAFSDFLFLNYNKFGWGKDEGDSDEESSEMGMERIKYFEMVVLNIVNTVEATYYRALNGGERESFRTARHVMQNEPLGQSMGYPGAGMNKKKSIFKPWTWGG